jgi:hypothetical protein
LQPMAFHPGGRVVRSHVLFSSRELYSELMASCHLLESFPDSASSIVVGSGSE